MNTLHQPLSSPPPVGGYPQNGSPPIQQGYSPPPYPPQGPVTYPAQQGFMAMAPQGQGQYFPSAPTGRYSQMMRCNMCGFTGPSQISYDGGVGMWAAVLVGLCVCTPCAWVPCFVNDFKDVMHRCGSCGNVLGMKTVI